MIISKDAQRLALFFFYSEEEWKSFTVSISYVEIPLSYTSKQ